MSTIKLGIRELVEFTLRSGDIKATFLSSKRAVDGTKVHQKYQKKQKAKLDNLYLAEVPLKYVHKYVHKDGGKDGGKDEDDELILSGRVDGIDLSEGIILDEIKSTNRSLVDITYVEEMHMAQLKLYGYIYAMMEGLENIGLRIIYIELESSAEKIFEYTVSIKELAIYFNGVVDLYMAFFKKVVGFEEEAHHTIKSVSFPFEDYRKGQKTLMRYAYNAIDAKDILFCRAPTGIGKTIGTLYPALKAVANNLTDKLFYLTAKTIGKEVARNTLALLESEGTVLKYIIITAKEKTCLNDTVSCTPEDCPYAKGHFDRVNKAIDDIYTDMNCFDRSSIEDYARKHMVCPYEFSLDLSLFSSVIICDYNYAFDPSAMLRRFFVEGTGRYTLLIDEAHNLVNRAREMYSGELTKSGVLGIRRLVKPLDKRLYALLGQLNTWFLQKRKEVEITLKDTLVEKEAPDAVSSIIRGIIHRTEKIFAMNKNWAHMDLLLDFYFASYDFIKKMELYSEHYVTYYERNRTDIRVKLFCMNPSDNLKTVLGQMKGVVYFSATLTPMPYFMSLLGGDLSSTQLMIGSPFPQDNLGLIIDDKTSTKYVDRPESILPIISTIHSTIAARSGHYIVYFPSYKYMHDVLEKYEPYEDEILIIQERGQREEEKEAFVNHFHDVSGETKVGFAVLGGMYGEGIDLIGDKLSGVIIVGVGLPRINFEGDLLKAHFDQQYGKGFEYAYIYPGMNKVLQSAGRVIRTSMDRGVVVLIDSRFRRGDYAKLFPKEWDHRQYLSRLPALGSFLTKFWAESDNVV
ncbi:MAG: ATP-dependent DNA helicase [Vallitaleaceae bacterium]|jgi:DNA excision repair protein ERCC-2|nr:ATP-dependent DNA helicase [Vallitaleaceae bacterium]